MKGEEKMRTRCIQCNSASIVVAFGKGETTEGEIIMLGLCHECDKAKVHIESFFKDDYVPDWEREGYERA